MKNEDFKILLVDDEKDILEFLSYNLKKEGFVVLTAESGKEAIDKAKQFKPDLIVLDIMMPDMDGVETCIEFRKYNDFKNTIIIFLTARNEDYSQIAGLNAGADDFISKPIKPKVFISKINSLIRRLRINEDLQPSLIEIDNLKIDVESYIVYVQDTAINLPKKEFELLCLLISKPNKVYTRDEIFAKIWEKNVFVGDRTIDVHIRKLRSKLNTKCIKTIKGIGYKFEA